MTNYFVNELYMQNLFQKVADELTASGLPATFYMIKNYSGYQPITGETSTTVYCIEAELGPDPIRPHLMTYAIGQVFSSQYPNLSLATTLVLHPETGQPASATTQFTKDIDGKFSTIFLPVMYRGFNVLDPTGQLKSQVMQRYTRTRVLLQDFISAGIMTLRLLLCCKMTGQLATIAADFSDLLTRLLAGLITPFLTDTDIDLIVATKDTSTILVPTRKRTDPSAPPYTVTSTTAVDQGFSAALQYLNQHYSANNYTNGA